MSELFILVLVSYSYLQAFTHIVVEKRYFADLYFQKKNILEMELVFKNRKKERMHLPLKMCVLLVKKFRL